MPELERVFITQGRAKAFHFKPRADGRLPADWKTMEFQVGIKKADGTYVALTTWKNIDLGRVLCTLSAAGAAQLTEGQTDGVILFKNDPADTDYYGADPFPVTVTTRGKDFAWT